MIITHTVIAQTQVDAHLSINNMYSKKYKIDIIKDAEKIGCDLWQMTVRITKVITYIEFTKRNYGKF